VKPLSARDWGLFGAIAALALDQLSKAVLLYGFGFAQMAPGDRIIALPFLDLVMAWNRGISFSLFWAREWFSVLLLIAFSAAVVIVLAIWLWNATRRVLALGLGLIIGGALGNLVDRVIYGRVADFFDLHLGERHFFACNVADVAITCGVVLLLCDILFAREPAGAAAS
jgi:signal peptidase II